MSSAVRARSRTERGSAVVEATWLTLLLLVPLLYVMLAVFDVQRAAFGTSAAARAAARAYSLAPDEATAPGRAHAAAALALRDQRLDAAQVELSIHCRPLPDNCLAPGSRITVDLRHQVDLPLTPTALGEQTPSIRVDASHTIGYGTYREDR